MKRLPLLVAIFVLTNGFYLHGQRTVPHPFAYAGPEGMGGGYKPLAFIGGAGLRIDSPHFILDSSAWYDNGKKDNDGTGPNPKGHDRGLIGSAYYRLSSGWFFGAGARWSELSTTNYKKSHWRPTFGGGKDYFHHAHCQIEDCGSDFSMRLGVDYLLKGSDWQNGTHGVLVSLYIPSPAEKGHLFWRESIGIYRFHDTVTDRLDPVLTRTEQSHTSHDSYAEFTVMYRF